jgi:2,5-diamino-6-(ribosylamino)-4(3H)-pyrimidinone 5'-phosphate reductase
MKPKVIMHTQISLDGCIRGFDCPELYYVVAGGIDADMVLFGSNTVAMAFEQVPPETEADFAKPEILPGDVRPFGIIPDSRGRLRNLHAARNMGYLKDLIILVSETTPQEYLEYLKERNYDFIVAGKDHADYKKAFEILNERYGCRKIRTDTGGTLTSVLLGQGLVDEISLIVSPCLIGKAEYNVFRSLSLPDRTELKLLKAEPVGEGGYLSLTYEVLRRDPSPGFSIRP